LRTAIAWQVLAERRQSGQGPDWSRLNPDSKSWAAREFEVHLFAPGAGGDKRRAPNYDLLRALRVSDSEPAPPDALGLCEVQIYPPKGSALGTQSLNLCQEVLLPRATLRGHISVDAWLLHNSMADQIGLKQLAGKLTAKNLAVAGRNMARTRIHAERQYFEAKRQDAIRDWYAECSQELEKMRGSNKFLLQIGWGAGWDSKTFSRDLRQDKQVAKVVDRFYARSARQDAPSRAARPAGPAPAERPFPASRHVALKNGKPYLPMGWIMINLEDAHSPGDQP